MVYSARDEYTIPAGTMEAGKDYKIYIAFGNQSDYYAEIGAEIAVKAEGTAAECDHSAGHYNDVLDESVEPIYSNITETTHCVQYSYKRYCQDCGAYIENVLGEAVAPVAHDFSEGNTCDCGFQKVEAPEDKPYVRGFVMSQTSAKLGESVDFTLDIANFKEGETLTIEFCADSWKETFKLTAPNTVFSRAFSQEGNRSIKFRVVGGEYCSAQTLVVESNRAEIVYAAFSPALDKAYKETKEGRSFIATVGCNAETEIVELYIGKDGKYYAYSGDYEERDGVRIFTLPLSLTLGENNEGYAGEYEVFVNALAGMGMPVEDSRSFGTLTIQHVNTTRPEPGTKFYKYTAEGHTLYQETTQITTCEICGHKSTKNGSVAIGKETAHSIGENGKCSVCDWSKNVFETLDKGKDYKDIKSMKAIISDEKEAIEEWDRTGIIRYVEQFGYNKNTGAFYNYTFEEYWGNDKNIWGKSNGSQQYPTNMCTRAAASMAFSYLGKNVLPKDMKDEFGSYYDSAAKNVGCIVDGRNYRVEKITTEQFLEWYNDYASDKDGVYSPVSIRAFYYNKRTGVDNNPHAFTIIGRSSTDPNRFYIADPGKGRHILEIILQDVNGELRIAEYIGDEKKVFSGHIVTDIWRYVRNSPMA